jgi:DNA polymerase-3 subunit beta
MLQVACGQQALLESVQIVSRGVSGRSTQPVQNNIMLEAKEGQLRLVATDLEYISLEAVLEAEVVEEGATTVPARLLAEVVAALPHSNVSLQAREDHGIEISCGSARYEMRGLAATDFAMLPPVTVECRFELSQAELLEVLEHTVFATSRDETRPILTGAQLKLSEQGLEMVATDTYRLALQKLALENPPDQLRSAIISRRALAELIRILDRDSKEPVVITLTDSQAEFQIGSITVGSRLIEGQFVNYEKVIPVDFERRIIVNSKDLGAALHRAAIVAKDDDNRVVLKTDEGQLLISAASKDVGQVEESVAIELEGDNAEIAFNARYMLDMIGACSCEAVAMELSGPLNSGIMRPVGDDTFLYVLMPMQIM